jgi:hypothetical protein
MLFFLQFIMQLLLIPQGNLGGQLMFLASFAIVWANNCVHGSIDKEAVQMDLLRQSIYMTIEKYEADQGDTLHMPCPPSTPSSPHRG